MTAKRTSKKELIMETAKRLFSEKGYDATGMGEIALQAEIPKSLIYYHFKSKEDLLHAIISTFFSEYEQLIQTNHGEEIGSEKYFSFLYENKEFVKIIIVESFKSKTGASAIFEVIKTVLQQESLTSGSEELTDYNLSHSRWVAEFFTSIVPFAMFSCYVDDWCSHFETDIETAKKDFLNAYEQTYGAYHERLESGE